MMPLRNELHERFAIAFAALELVSPGKPGNQKRAYQHAQPEASEKTSDNQGSTLLQREDVRDRVEWLLLSGKGAEHITRVPAFIDDLALKAIPIAEAENDAATIVRLVELLDRGRLGGPRFVKETRQRKSESPFAGKSADEIRAMKRAAARELAKSDPELVSMLMEERGEADGKSSEPDRVGARDRTGEPVH